MAAAGRRRVRRVLLAAAAEREGTPQQGGSEAGDTKERWDHAARSRKRHRAVKRRRPTSVRGAKNLPGVRAPRPRRHGTPPLSVKMFGASGRSTDTDGNK